MTAITQNARPRRLTQPERSAATRQALLDSTIECLIELGYDQSTTAVISERAGLSRGAHLHHFQTRGALIVAAADELARRMGTDLEDRIEQLPDGSEQIGAALDMVWEVFSGPLFRAVLELAVHARTETELRANFGPLEQVVRHGSGRLLRRAFGRKPGDRSVDDVIALVLSTIRGLAILPILDPTYDPTRRWRFCRTALLDMLQAASHVNSPARVGAGQGTERP